MHLTIRPATVIEAKWLGHNLREEDRREVETATGMAASAVVPASLSTSRECYTARRAGTEGYIEQDPFLCFGVADDPRNDGAGIIWLLATDKIRGANLSVLREASYWIDAWLRKYPCGLHNIVDARNSLHLRWLKLLGFSFEKNVEINGQTFIHAIRRK